MSEVSGEINALAQKNQSISDSSVQIATAAEEQGVVADNIAASVEEIREQASGIHKTIQSTTQTIKQLRQQSDQLERLLTGLKA
ncbi:putative methyl-accepting chemotaxis protein [Vibrio mimicus VM573]|nr:putative methyl-accepting chemotaxis protein [Vibrio mimicus VM573]